MQIGSAKSHSIAFDSAGVQPGFPSPPPPLPAAPSKLHRNHSFMQRGREVIKENGQFNAHTPTHSPARLSKPAALKAPRTPRFPGSLRWAPSCGVPHPPPSRKAEGWLGPVARGVMISGEGGLLGARGEVSPRVPGPAKASRFT